METAAEWLSWGAVDTIERAILVLRPTTLLWPRRAYISRSSPVVWC